LTGLQIAIYTCVDKVIEVRMIGLVVDQK